MSKSIFKVGDKVFDISYGWGEVIRIKDISSNPIYVVFDCSKSELYSTSGKKMLAENITLSFTEYTLDGFSQERPEPEIEKGTPVWCKDKNSSIWAYAKYLKKYDFKHTVENVQGARWYYDEVTTTQPEL
jgi:hypothetical protein